MLQKECYFALGVLSSAGVWGDHAETVGRKRSVLNGMLRQCRNVGRILFHEAVVWATKMATIRRSTQVGTNSSDRSILMRVRTLKPTYTTVIHP